MGGAGDPPAPVGDPPTGTGARNVAKRPCRLARIVAPVPSGESPYGTGESPVLPANQFSNTLLVEPDRFSWQAAVSCFLNSREGGEKRLSRSGEPPLLFPQIKKQPLTWFGGGHLLDS